MNSIDPIELGMACIFCIVYIGGKVWMYYNTNETKTIKRGKEWD